MTAHQLLDDSRHSAWDRLGALAPSISSHELTDLCRAVIARVEVHPASVHLVIGLRHLSTATQERVGVDRIRSRILPGDQIMADPERPGHVRIVLPVRLKVRGGRTWVDIPDGRGVFRPAPPDRIAIRRLRRAHAVLKDCGIEPDEPPLQMRQARAPHASYHTRLGSWAFLAPDIQRDILTGRIGTEALAALKAEKDVPLSWSDQRALLRRDAPPRRPPSGFNADKPTQRRLDRPRAVAASIVSSNCETGGLDAL
jgi:site-specific DNA recombinase